MSPKKCSVFSLENEKAGVGRVYSVLGVLESKREVFLESLRWSSACEKLGDKIVSDLVYGYLVGRV